MSDKDLDQSGHGFQRVRTYLGPSLGWVEEFIQPTVDIRTGGAYAVKPGDSLLLVDVPAIVTIQLPDVVQWMQQPSGRPATGFDRSITVKDLGGNAATYNIVISPFGQQAIDNIQQSVTINFNRATIKLIPLVDMSGWAVETASTGQGGGGGGGGDVFKAGNNTFTGSNNFVGPIIVPVKDLTDNTASAATTSFVKGQNYLTGTALLPYALLASPTFTGVPKAPIPALNASDDTIATIGSVEAAIAAIPATAPITAEYVLAAVAPGVLQGRVLTNTATVTWDFSTAGQVKATAISSGGGGTVTISGTPISGQLARWTDPDTIEGVNPDVAGCQPLDGDLTAISALLGTNTIYYRSADSIWSPVTFSGLSFSGGVLGVTGGGGTINASGTITAGLIAQWTDATHIKSDNTLTNDLTIVKSQPLLTLDKTSGSSALIIGKNAGLTRWQIIVGNGAAEGGSNVGSDFALARYGDTGVLIDFPLTIGRNTGTMGVNAVVAIGDVTVSKNSPQLNLNKPASGTSVFIQGQTNTLNRWQVIVGSNAAESGSNTGSDFLIGRNNDAGANIDYPIAITRSTGIVAFPISPTAPTPAAADNSTKVATTAFVKTATTRTAFSANANANQTIPNETYTKVNFANAIFNDSTLYNTSLSRWTPPAGRCQIMAHVTHNGANLLIGTPIYCAVYKNGTQIRVAIGSALSINGGGAGITIIDVCSGTDYYEIWTFAYSTGSSIVPGTGGFELYTWFMGTTL